jgi:hypothetical protein
LHQHQHQQQLDLLLLDWLAAVSLQQLGSSSSSSSSSRCSRWQQGQHRFLQLCHSSSSSRQLLQQLKVLQ